MSMRKGKAPPPAGSGSGAAGKVSDEKADMERQRYTKLIMTMGSKAPPKAAPYIQQAAPVIATGIVLINTALPYIIQYVSIASKYIAQLPENVLTIIAGLVLCFFGGVFPATIAAYEAWRLCGGKEAIYWCQELWEQAKLAYQAVEEDEKKVQEESKAGSDTADPKEVLERKGAVVLKAVDPERLSEGITALWTGWIGVVATLKIQFAKAVTLGASIGQLIYNSAHDFVEPVLEGMVSEEYKRWVPIAVRWCCKAVAISIAWWIQRVISAFHSAVRGGLLCGRAVIDELNQRKIISFNEHESNLDEIAGWGLAALGLLFQFYMGFSLFFPLNLLLLPLRFLEAYIVWSVGS